MIENVLISMSSEQIKDMYFGKKVRVVTDKEEVIEGIVSEIVLSSTPNPQSGVHLPVSIKVGNENIDIFKIKSIDIL